jgi:hypothetical protein
MAPQLKPTKRDAPHLWGGINYQRLVTLCAWLQLEADELLFVELEEDLAVVRPFAAQAVQVRRKKAPISLHNMEAIKVIETAYARGEGIFTVYWATGPIGREDGQGGLGGKPGIELWNLAAEGNDQALESVRGLLLKRGGLSKRLTAELRTEPPGALREALFHRLTWQMSRPPARRLQARAETALLALLQPLYRAPAHLAAQILPHCLKVIDEVAAKVLPDDRWLDRARLLRIVEEVVAANRNISALDSAEWNDERRIGDGHEAQPRVSPLLYNVPRLPLRHYPRISDLERARALVLRPAPCDEPVGASLIGIVGMGGLGKSVLATALGREFACNDRFRDGIFWIGVGQASDPLVKAGEFGRALSMANPNFSTVAEARGQLGLRTHSARLLVILDDVWESKSLEPFLSLGAGCMVVVTSRDRTMLDHLTENVLELGLLDAGSSAKLLAIAADAQVERLDKDALDVVAMCGGLPLAIAAAAGLVRVGTFSWRDLAAILRERALDEIPTTWLGDDDRRSLWGVLDLSVRSLSETTRQCFVSCAAFRKSVVIPENAFLRSWAGIVPSLRDRKRRVQDLVDRCLLQRVGAGRYRIHDLYLDYLANVAGPADLAHARLLRAYNPNDLHWSSVDDDEYIHDNLFEHLVEAGQLAIALSLFDEERWMRARVERDDGDYVGYLRDIDTTLRALTTDGGERADPDLFSKVLAIVLVRGTINALDDQYSSALIARAFELGFWSFERAVNKARSHEPIRRLRIIGRLSSVPGLSAPQLDVLNDRAWEAWRDLILNKRFDAGEGLVLLLRSTDKGRVEELRDAFEQVNNHVAFDAVVFVLGEDKHPLRDYALDRLLRFAEASDWEATNDSDHVQPLAHHLAAPQFADRLSALLERIRALPERGFPQDSPRAGALVAILPALDKRGRCIADQLLKEMSSELGKARLLAAFARLAADKERHRLIARFIECVERLNDGRPYDKSDRAEAISSLEVALDDHEALRLFRTVARIRRLLYLQQALRALEPHVSDFVKSAMVRRISRWRNDERRLYALSPFLDVLPQTQFDAWFEALLLHEDRFLHISLNGARLCKRLSKAQTAKLFKLVQDDPRNLGNLALFLPAELARMIRSTLERQYHGPDELERFYEREDVDGIRQASQYSPKPLLSFGLVHLTGALLNQASESVRSEFASRIWAAREDPETAEYLRYALKHMTPDERRRAFAEATAAADHRTGVNIAAAIAPWLTPDDLPALQTLWAAFTDRTARYQFASRLRPETALSARNLLVGWVRAEIAEQQNPDCDSLEPLAGLLAHLAPDDALDAVKELRAEHNSSSSSAIALPQMLGARALFGLANIADRYVAFEMFIAGLAQPRSRSWIKEAIENLLPHAEALSADQLRRLVSMLTPYSSLSGSVASYCRLDPYLEPSDQNTWRGAWTRAVIRELETAAIGKSKGISIRSPKDAEVDKVPSVIAAASLLGCTWLHDRKELVEKIWSVVDTFNYSHEYRRAFEALSRVSTEEEFRRLIERATIILDIDTDTGTDVFAALASAAPSSFHPKIVDAALAVEPTFALKILRSLPNSSDSRPPDDTTKLDDEARKKVLAYAVNCKNTLVQTSIVRCHARRDLPEEVHILREVELNALIRERSWPLPSVCEFANRAIVDGGFSGLVDSQHANFLLQSIWKLSGWHWI